MRWWRKLANIWAQIAPAAEACGVVHSWTWSSSAPVMPVAATWRRPMRATARASAVRMLAQSRPWAAARGGRPHVGAIAVMGRRGGGHVGVVSGVDPNGNPIVVSGNHNRTVAESVYPAGRISAYVLPGGGSRLNHSSLVSRAPFDRTGRGFYWGAGTTASPG